MMKTLVNKIKELHRDEQGADMVEYILIVCAIGLPLLAVAIWFWKDISVQASKWWADIKGEQSVAGQTDPANIPGH